MAIDGFRENSADIESSSGSPYSRDVMTKPPLHIVAMTGSYFRSVLLPEDEAKFYPVFSY